MSRSMSRSVLQIVLLGGALAAAAPSLASAACVSTPITASQFDPYGDAESGVSPEATALTVSIDSACTATFGYAIQDQSYGLLSSDSLTWFIDTDGNVATGSSLGFHGADYAMIRSGSGGTLLTRYSSATASFVGAGYPAPSGEFAVTVDLTQITPFGQHAMTVAGGAGWKSSGGTTYYDWVPEPGQAPLPFTAWLTEYTPAPPAAPVIPVAPAVPSAPPAPVAATPEDDADDISCVVPQTRNLSLSKAKARLRAASCKPGSIRRRASNKVKKGKVIGLSQPVGMQRDAGASIRIFVSTGPSAQSAGAVAPQQTAAELLNEINAVAGGRR
jgi:hypothetical protein